MFNSSKKDRYNLPINVLVNCEACLQAGGSHFAMSVKREILMCGGNTTLTFQVDGQILPNKVDCPTYFSSSYAIELGKLLFPKDYSFH
jgi:hypothetical protein